jgi:L-lactate dehydrogenase (cytochrome)
MASNVTNIEDLRFLAKKRTPRMFYDYVDTGSWSGSTYRANETDLQRIHLRPRVMIDVSNRQLASTMVGQPVTMPLALAPTGLTGMLHANGEVLAARAAEKAGVPFTLSTMSICSIETVADAVSAPFWFQLYFMRDRDFINRLMDRAKAAGCPVLVVTVDLPTPAQRHKDIKNGMTVPPRLRLSNLIDIARRPRWWLRMLGTSQRTFGNLAGHIGPSTDLRTISAWSAQQFDPSVVWDDVRRARDRWGGKLVIKGIMNSEDAEAAVHAGADAVLVSNHGGRQLDGAVSSISALGEIVRQVEGRTEVLFDGGIRSGQDMLKALALGAHGVMIGRAFLYGLAALGESGVSQAISIIRKEFDLSMALTGIRNVNDINDGILVSADRSRFPSGLD